MQPRILHSHPRVALTALSVTKNEPRRWHVSAPKSPKTFLQYQSPRRGMPGDTIALIRTTHLCSELCRTRTKPLCYADDTEVQLSASLFWSAHGRDKVLGTECLNEQEDFSFGCMERPSSRTVDMSVPPADNYKVCFRKAASCANSDCWPEWRSTGLQVQVQALVTGLEINGAGGHTNPGQGQRAVIPRARFHTFQYKGFDISGSKLKLLRGNEECSDLTTASKVSSDGSEMGQAKPGIVRTGKSKSFRCLIFATCFCIHLCD